MSVNIPTVPLYLDSICGIMGLARLPGESDDDLAARMLALMNPPYPHPTTMRLFYFLAKLGLKSPRRFLPAGIQI